MTHQQWANYFKELVAEHKFLTPSTQTKHFFFGEYDEFFSQFRSRVVFPAFIFESSQIDVDIQPHQTFLKRTMCFICCSKYTRDDYEDINRVLSNCEKAGLSILGRLQNDITTADMCNYRILDIHAEPCVNEPQHYCGWRFEFVVSDPSCIYLKSAFRESAGNLLLECGHNLQSEDNTNISLE